MNQSTYNALKSFIWGIANDCLVDVYDVGDYRKVILPMLVIRRFDAVLEQKHDEVAAAKKKFEKEGVAVDIDPALCKIAGQAFVNKSDFTLCGLKSRTNQQQLRKDFIDYLDGFSKNVQEIINKFHFRDQIPRLSEQDRLGLLIEKFVDPSINLSNKPVLNEDGSEKLEALDNHTMGTLFEEVIRMFNEQTNVTDAGRHFTPRDIIELMADLAFIPIQDQIQSTTYRIYDGACGTGGMLTVGESCIQNLAERRGKKVSINLFGQENFDETYAIACADMLLKGEGAQANNLFFGSTISNDGFPKEEFDFMLSNPPFGTSWKAELKAWGDIKKDEITDAGISTFLWVVTNHKEDRRKGHIQLIDASSLKKPLRKNVGEKNSEISPEVRRQIIDLYLAYADADPNFSKIFSNKEFGYYSVGIQRPLRLRVDLNPERVTALKEDLNDKEMMNLIALYLEKGNADKCMNFNLFMQDIEKLAAASSVKLTAKRKKAIRDFLTEIDENAEPVLDSKGKPEPDKNLRDTEQIPLLYEGGVERYWENEIKPYVPDSWIDEETIGIGYELSFTKYFYKPLELRTPEEIISDIQTVESNTDGLLASIIGGLKNA